MADPTKYTPAYSYSGWQATNPSRPLPADEVDNDFANVSRSVNQTIDALKDIRRSDGKLKNQSVGPDQLSPALTIGFSFTGTWIDGHSYSAGDGVVKDDTFYSARIAHTADVSNAPGNDAYWNELFSLNDIVVTGGMALPRDSFVGDGVTKDFTLSFTPLSKFNLFVQVGGVVQGTDAYSSNGNTLSFINPPPNGYGIEVRGFATVSALVVPEDGSVDTEKLADQAVTEPKLSVDVAAKLNGAMQKATYDPQGKEADAFDSVNIDYKAAETAVERSVSSRLMDAVSARDFGCVGDGVTDDTAAMQAAFNYSVGRAVHFPAGVYKHTSGLIVPASAKLYGDAFDADVNVGRPLRLTGTVFLATGTAPKSCYALGITDDRTSGGRVDNSADADFGATDAFMSLASYYNNDANPVTGEAATPAPFSAAVKFAFGAAGIVMQDIRIILNFDGVNGYNNKTLSLADDWDVGLYMDNARYCELRNVQVLGYWRKNGLLDRTGALAREEAENGFYSGAEENKFYNCVFQGWKSVGIRSPGMFRAMAVTSTYIEVPWADNHPFDSVDSRITAFEFAPRNVTITSKSKVGSNLRLMTATDETANIPVGTEIAPAFIGNGVAGTVFQHCRMHGMWHSSGRRISDPAIAGAMAPSACVEISGTRIRGPRFEGCKFQTVDDIGAQLHQCIDVILGPNARFEGSTPSANGPGGIRMISTPSDTVAYPGRVRETFRVQLHSEQPGADFTPSFGTRGAKFSTDGFWVPNVCGEIFQGGIYVGPYNENTLLREYLVGGFTPTLSFATNGDLAVTSQTRAGSVEYCGEWLRFNIRHSAMLTWSTASGRLRMSLPRAIYSQSNLLHAFECSYEGITLPAGRTQLHAEGQNGTSFAEFVASGSGVARSYISTSNLASGAFVTVVMSGMYRFQR